MPGTTYTATPPRAEDAAGRLADFARYAVGELERIREDLNAVDAYDYGDVARRADYHAGEALRELADVARLLEGFTTADD
jgi:hypothetical protein